MGRRKENKSCLGLLIYLIFLMMAIVLVAALTVYGAIFIGIVFLSKYFFKFVVFIAKNVHSYIKSKCEERQSGEPAFIRKLPDTLDMNNLIEKSEKEENAGEVESIEIHHDEEEIIEDKEEEIDLDAESIDTFEEENFSGTDDADYQEIEVESVDMACAKENEGAEEETKENEVTENLENLSYITEELGQDEEQEEAICDEPEINKDTLSVYDEANSELIEALKECGDAYVNFFNEILGIHSALKDYKIIENEDMEFIIEFDAPEWAEYIANQEDKFNRNMQSLHKISVLENNCISLIVKQSEENAAGEPDAAVENFLDISNNEKDVDKQEAEEKQSIHSEYIFPVIDLLKEKMHTENCSKEIGERAEKLKQTFKFLGVSADIVDVLQGARFTRFEIRIGGGVRIRDILRIEEDIKLHLKEINLSIEAPIPGRTTIGIDVENKELSVVTLREVLESNEFKSFPSDLTVAIGKDVEGKVVVESIDNMVHLLIAGSTGTGKSSCINAIIMSILYKANPKDVKMIMIDPKVIELSVYNGIPHLLIPVVTDPGKASAALKWAVAEMAERYRKFAALSARSLNGYNEKVAGFGEPSPAFPYLPRIIIIIDDLTILMLSSYKNEIEDLICHFTQAAYSVGMHLIVSTQRPSADIVTGRIKANITSRISFDVFSVADSIAILNEKGAERLLGDGDMLFYPKGQSAPLRVQGAFVSDSEINAVVDFLKEQTKHYSPIAEKVIHEEDSYITANGIFAKTGMQSDWNELLFADAGRLVIKQQKASIGMLQRMYKIGFNRAARIMDQLTAAGVVGPEEGTKPRRILMSLEQFEQLLEEII